MNHTLRNLSFAALLISPVALGCGDEASSAPSGEWVDVSGTGIHYFSTAVVHSMNESEGVTLQRSTETVDLQGDLTGRVLYHPETRIDAAAGTLVNTGHQVFSGVVLGSEPVLISDESFRFEVNLATGATTGQVHLQNMIAGPTVECELTISDAVPNEAGDSTLRYTGRCRL